MIAPRRASSCGMIEQNSRTAEVFGLILILGNSDHIHVRTNLDTKPNCIPGQQRRRVRAVGRTARAVMGPASVHLHTTRSVPMQVRSIGRVQ